MIPPQELKNKSFSRTAKGYDIAEVDEYLDFIVEKYSELYAQCAKYDKKLRAVSSRISEIQQEEELMRRLSVSTQKNCDRLTAEAEEEAKNTILKARETAGNILGDAKENAQAALAVIEQKAVMQIESTQKKADALLLSARTRCTKLLGDFKKEIAVQSENIAKIKSVSEEFNSKLLSMYKNHLNLLSENTSIPNVELEKFNESGLFDAVMREIKNDAVEIAQKNTGIEYDFDSELEVLRASKAAVSEAKMEERPAEPAKTSKPEEPDVYGEFDEDEDEDDDIKIFDKAGAFGSASPAQDRGPEDGFAEKPLATYDSDDYSYETDDQDDVYETYGANAGNEDRDEDEDDEEEEDDSVEVSAKSKGFFGLFKKKQPTGKKRGNDIDDDEDSIDIFEDLDDE